VVCARPAFADDAAPASEEHSKAVALVRQLGSRSFRVREQAARELMKMKLAARQAVEEGIKDKDPEVRRRCGQLLPDILRAELFARIAAFVADKEGKRDHHLPGWKLFRELAGPGEDARQLFADLSRREIELLDLLEKNPSRAGTLSAKRCERLWNMSSTSRGMALLPGDVIPLFLVTADKRAGVGTAMGYQLCGMLDRPGLREEMTVKGPGSPFKRLVVAWMGRLTEDYALSRALEATERLQMPERFELAKKVVRNKGGGGARGHALVLLGKADAKAHVALFESLLEDTASVAGFGIGVANGPNIQGQTEVRDIALAMLVHATGQKHDDYGFAYTRAGRSFLFNAPFLGFSSKEERETAFKKWRTWKASQKKK
jgi:hypothetical protein